MTAEAGTREDLMDGFVFLALLLVLAAASRRFGVDSRPGINRHEGFFAFAGRQL